MKERGSDKERKRGSTEYRYMEGAPCGYCGVRPLVSLSRVHLYFSFFLVFCSSSRLFLFSTFSFPMSFTPFLLSRFIKPLICYLGKIFPRRYLGNRPIQSRAAHCV